MPDSLTYSDFVAIHRAVEDFAAEEFPKHEGDESYFIAVAKNTANGRRECGRAERYMTRKTGLRSFRATEEARIHLRYLADSAIDA